jgi:hypothetical protein
MSLDLNVGLSDLTGSIERQIEDYPNVGISPESDGGRYWGVWLPCREHVRDLRVGSPPDDVLRAVSESVVTAWVDAEGFRNLQRHAVHGEALQLSEVPSEAIVHLNVV